MQLTTIYAALLWMLLPALQTQAQSVHINEVMASNSRYLDEDGDMPDWIELTHQGSSSISLQDWSITDDLADTLQWVFSDIQIRPAEHLLIWASNKDRAELTYADEIITEGSACRYIIPTAATDAGWRELDFDDTDWTLGNTGIGYADGDDTTLLPSGTSSVFIRHSFMITDPDQIKEMVLHMDYDDAFVAYLNGKEIARANLEAVTIAYNTLGTTDREAIMYQGLVPERYSINDLDESLVAGKNTLAVQVHNVSPSSSDMSAIAFLTAKTLQSGGTDPDPLLGVVDGQLHTNFKISSSAESIYLFDAQQQLIDSIRIESLAADVSLGRDTLGQLRVYFEPTPGRPNAASPLEAITDTIQFSLDADQMKKQLILSTAATADAFTIRYTTDSSIPTELSRQYTGPISLTKNTVVRARLFAAGHRPTETQTKVYLHDIDHDLPVISLVTASNNFYDIDTGIYVFGRDFEQAFPHFGANFWDDVEKPIHVSFMDAQGQAQYEFDAGVKIFGGWSRAFNQRSLSIFARKQYGLSRIEYPLFRHVPYQNFEALVLRNSGNDWASTMCRDGMLTGLMRDSHVDIQAYQPVATYLNGTYFGLYNLREKINEHSLASKHDLDPDDITILEKDSEIIRGQNDEYKELIEYVRSNDLRQDVHYSYVRQRVDIQNYIQYQLTQIFFDNTDWPGNNIKFWKHKKGKWRWILFDTDFGFGMWGAANVSKNTLRFALESAGPSWPNPPWSTFLFRRLMTNTEFRNQFINQYADELNSRFLPQKVRAHIDSTSQYIADEIMKHRSRWPQSANRWQSDINVMKQFATQRSAHAKNHIKAEFNLPNFYTLTVSHPDGSSGYVRVNSLRIDQTTWSGDYFATVPITVKAIPAPGYEFAHWLGDLSTSNPEETMDVNRRKTITPVFRIATQEALPIVINEINYNSSNDYNTQDWVELYNPREDVVDLSAWMLTDGSDKDPYLIPEGTTISAQGYLVLAHDLNKFEALLPELRSLQGNFRFGLSKNGDTLKLFDQHGELEDSVAYSSTLPWPEEANGTGSTLELIDPSLDNNLPESWARLHATGSPGKNNLSTSTLNIATDQYPIELFPNPFSSMISLSFDLKTSEDVHLGLYHTNGVNVKDLLHRRLTAGNHQLEYDLESLPEGIYVLRFMIDDLTSVYKLIKAR